MQRACQFFNDDKFYPCLMTFIVTVISRGRGNLGINLGRRGGWDGWWDVFFFMGVFI